MGKADWRRLRALGAPGCGNDGGGAAERTALAQRGKEHGSTPNPEALLRQSFPTPEAYEKWRGKFEEGGGA